MKRSAPFALVLLVGIGGCGLGTEIGNGFKSDGGSDDTSSTAKKQAKSGAGTPDAASAPEAPADAKAGNSQSESDPMVVGGSPSAAPDAAAVPLPFDLRMLYTSCATPFATIPHKSLVLNAVTEGAAPVPRLKADWVEKTDQAAEHWVLKDVQDVVLAQIEPNQPVRPNLSESDIGAMIFDADHKPLGDTFRCGAPIARGHSDSLSIYQKSTDSFDVPILKDDVVVTTLSWTLDDGKLQHVKAAGVTLTPGE